MEWNLGLFAIGVAGTGAAIGERRSIRRTSLALVLLKPLRGFGYRLPFLRCPTLILDFFRVPSTKDRAANRPIQTARRFRAHGIDRAPMLGHDAWGFNSGDVIIAQEFP
jgi:hypothetical protein